MLTTIQGLIDPNTSDGRVIFFLPWQGNTIAGTTDAPTTITPQPLPTEEEITWILDEVRRYLSPDITVRREDVLAAWSGIRPLVKDPDAKNTESLVRNHLINKSVSGLITIAGGKWTTYRQMAEEAVDEAINAFSLRPVPRAVQIAGTQPVTGACNTENILLVGAQGFSKTLFINLIQHFQLPADVAKHLAYNYGDRAWTVAQQARNERIAADQPFIESEILYAVRHEYAQTAADVLARRTRMAFLNVEATVTALPKVIDVMASELKWSADRKNQEWKDTMKFLESMGLKKERTLLTRAQIEKSS